MLVYTRQIFAKFMLTNSELANFLQRYPVCSFDSLKLNRTRELSCIICVWARV